MLDDDNAKEMEAALREEEELDMPNGMTSDEWRQIREEAQAEEEFIADREDRVKPMIFQKKTEDGSLKKIDMRPEAHSVDASDGVLGSGDLEVERVAEPINNEVELIKEKVKDMDPDKNPDVAADPAADTPTNDSSFGGDTAAEPVATDSPVDAAPAGEPVAEPEPVAESAPAPETEAPADIINDGVEQAPSADVPAATDTPTPIPGGMPTSPVSTDAAAVAPVAEPKKKKKTGLIIGLVVFLLLVVGGVVGGILFYNSHEAPEQQVKDAVSNVLKAKTLGATKVSALESGQLPYIGMSVNSSSTPFGDASFSFDLAIKGTETFYMKVGGISDLMSKAMASMGGMSGASSSDEATKKLVDSIVKPFDGNWIALDVTDEESKETLRCVNESIKSLSSDSFRKKMSDAFDKYQFVKYKKDSKVESRDGINYYEVEIDEDLQKKFSKELEGAEELKTLENCSGNIKLSNARKSTLVSPSKPSVTKTEDEDEEEDEEDEEYDFDFDDDEDDWSYSYSDDDDDDFETFGTTGGSDFGFGTSEEGRTNTIKLGISSWSHELQAIEVVSETKDGKKDTFNVTFKTIAEGDVKDAKTIEKIAEEIKGTVVDAVAEYGCAQMKEQYGKQYSEYFTNDKQCIDMVKKEYEDQLKDMDLGDLMGGLGAGAIRTRA